MLFAWSEEKNELLKAERGISFEIIRAAYENGGLVDDVAHPNQDRYPGQRIMAIEMAGYIYLVPYVISDGHLFLKTAFPSRKANRNHKDQNS